MYRSWSNEATKCKQEPLCEGAEGDSDEACSKYIVQIGKEDSLICLFDPNKKNVLNNIFVNHSQIQLMAKKLIVKFILLKWLTKILIYVLKI